MWHLLLKIVNQETVGGIYSFENQDFSRKFAKKRKYLFK